MKQQEEKEFKELFGALEPEQPSMRFTRNVMDSIEGLPVASVSRSYVNPWVVKGIAAILVATVLILSFYIYNTADTLPKYNIALECNYTLYIIAANILLALIFLERLLSSSRRMKQLERLN
jgi:predicted membrane protein